MNSMYPMLMEWSTSQLAPYTATYVFVRFTEPDERTLLGRIGLPNEPTAEEREIPLNKGDKFPPITSCQRGAIWRLKNPA